MCHKPSNTDRNRDNQVQEIDTERYRNGSRIVVPTEPLPESSRERRDGPGGE